ncbi:hypothetical protein [Streptomyces sp. NPDC058092]|uniref:hypothetical protein n=1 Tax=Streptomyces sp. NPDC058092 TaxID=3346336 RepID=UPI0036E3FE2F
MTVDDGGIPLEDWAFAMRGIRPDSITTIKTNNGTFNSRTVPGVGSAEILSPTSMQLLQAVRDDTVDAFVAAHPDWGGRLRAGGACPVDGAPSAVRGRATRVRRG